MAKQNENLQKDQNELLAFVEKSDLGEREKEQMKQNLLEIFKFEDGLDENLASLKASTQSLQEFLANLNATLSSVRLQSEYKAIETRMAQRDKEFEALHNPSKEKQDEYLKANLADLKALSKAAKESFEGVKAKLEATRKKIETKFAGKENEALEFSPKFKEQIKSLFNNPNEGGKNVK